MPKDENGIKINVIIILGGLLIVIKNLLEKEIREVIIILIWEISIVIGVIGEFKIRKSREIYIILKLKYSVLEKDEIIINIFIDMLKLSI
jgi:hypothetical protein